MVPGNGLRLLDRLGLYDRLSLKEAQSTKGVLYSCQGGELGKLILGSWSAEKTAYLSMRVKRMDLQEVRCSGSDRGNSNSLRQTPLLTPPTCSWGAMGSTPVYARCMSIHSSRQIIRASRPSTRLVPVSARPPEDGVTSLTGTLTPHGMFAIIPCTASGDTLFWYFSYEVPMPASGNNSSRDGWAERSRMEEEAFKPTLLPILNDVHTQWGALLKEAVRKTDVVKFYPI
ncbi:uncharacterized protein Z519_04668 [Cladophialophora bantiana CBS 173.52]|uniref:Uncharacterized protein n=1 Tax=Cladophialophora bantiana (strain ATCC 10958 / CBS 173.52 / CDC B-1940 / NIH 8579) TaxID=1442370 RepID=A0A0D2EXK3_CLAB1|nr:uncharacterized protein Z519_04668 [Cladophialophora bantiana CBS 173.52]KIW94691.1 hypothetical protein Z519_04668 [Cladophialophora bantiana CBS 173.52]